MFFDELSDEEWTRVLTLIADEPIRLNRRGRPRAETRVVANAILWILTTGEPWSKLPGRYPSGRPAAAASRSGSRAARSARWSRCSLN